jgi:predicted adenylyl cyclase CyaB
MMFSLLSKSGFMEEIEIKFLVKDTKAVTEKLRKLGFRIVIGRHRERNYLFDDDSASLQRAGKLLRVRKTPSNQTVTYKGPILATSKLKHREEIECRVEDAETMRRILEETGFKMRTEYSKYRTVFAKEGFNVSLDETEAGNYLEVEGPSDEEITRLGTQLGYSEQDFVRRTYAELIGARRGTPGGDKELP